MVVQELERSAITDVSHDIIRLGLITPGGEERHRLILDHATLRAAKFILGHCQPDSTIRNYSRIFSRHETDDYDVVSSLRPSLEAPGFYRATSLIIPDLARTGFAGYFGETHLYPLSNPSVINPDHITVVENRHLAEFRQYGHYLQMTQPLDSNP